MFFSNEEEKVMGNLLTDISKEPHKEYVLKYQDGSILDVQQETCYETDNGLDQCDKKYLEYYSCAMRIKKVINDKTTEQKYKEKTLIEINYINYPEQIIDLYGISI